ncbi:TrmB family transcriptional regulator [Bacteroidota bacterium]
MIEQALEDIGLTKGETKIYLALLELGTTTTGKIIKKSKISGSKTYEILDRLIEKGLASFIIKNRTKQYTSSPPEKILNYLEEKEHRIRTEKRNITKILPELKQKQKQTEDLTEATIYKGWEGLKTANEDIINSLEKGEEWLSMGLTEQPIEFERHFNKRQKERAKKGIKVRHLLNQRYKSLYKQRKKLPNTEFKLLPKELEMPASIEIYKNKFQIMLVKKENPLSVLIENKDIANSFRTLFNNLWNQKTRTYIGEEGPRIVLKETIEAGRHGHELLGFGTDEDPYKDYLPADIEQHFREQIKYDVSWKLLFNKKFKSPNPLGEIRYLPEGFSMPIRTMIYGDKVAIVDFHKPFTTIIIDKKEIADSYRKQFKFLWSIAKK